MSQHDLEQWERTQAEIAIRRWLYSIGQWAPEAQIGALSAETALPAALDDQQIDQVLHAEVLGRIGCHADGKTYVVPVIYAYDGSSIYGHTNEGMKLRMLRTNPEVCFEVEHLESLTSWQSVIAWGRFEELRGEAADHAERLIVEHMRPHLADKIDQSLGQPAASEGASAALVEQRAIVYRIAVRERTGRYERR